VPQFFIGNPFLLAPMGNSVKLTTSAKKTVEYKQREMWPFSSLQSHRLEQKR